MGPRRSSFDFEDDGFEELHRAGKALLAGHGKGGKDSLLKQLKVRSLSAREAGQVVRGHS